MVVIGSERVGRRVVPSKDRATPHWTVVRPNGGAWGNVQDSSADSLPPPPPPPPLPPPGPLPSQTVLLNRDEVGGRSAGDEAWR